MKLSKQILQFYNNLDTQQIRLPSSVEVLNPYFNSSKELQTVLNSFYQKYYDDQNPRGLILGINPGRLGAGITGIPFTDSIQLESVCNINFPMETREISATFVYDVINAYGGPATFYQDWFIGAVSPLGYIHKNEKGNWVNWNYYDQIELQQAVLPFITDQLKKQVKICGEPKNVIVLGTGKNYQFLKNLNKDLGLFKEIIPLEHPRYIMQYKRRDKEKYIAKYLQFLSPDFIAG